VYFGWAILLIAQNPGLQYDEALLVLGSVHLLTSSRELTLPHDPNTWACVMDRCFPLMTVRYVGAIKEYICLPLFALFGASPWLLRLVSTALGAFGIWGIGRLAAAHIGGGIAAATAFIIAMHPAYVDLTVFDNGTVSIWMAAMGGLCLTLSRYLHRRDARCAMLLGIAAGMGVWARANFVWLLAAALGAAAIVLRRRLLVPFAHWRTGFAGGLIGGFPFLLYQVISRGGTFEAIGMFTTEESVATTLLKRAVLFSETLITDREHRAMWGGGSAPVWQSWVFATVTLAACVICLWKRGVWGRAVASTFALLGALLFSSRLLVSEHHLIALIPLAALITAIGFARLRMFAIPVAALYIGCAVYWQVAAVRGLARTGGVGQWSDAIFSVTSHLEQHHRAAETKILDWGLQNSIFVLSEGSVRSREIFADSTAERSGLGRPWIEEVRAGGVFLLNAPGNRHMPGASTAFLQALAQAGPNLKRRSFMQRNGAPYAEIIVVEPGTGQYPEGGAPSEGFILSTADPKAASRLEGFHQIEEGGWRWSRREFAVTLRSPPKRWTAGARLALELYIPDTVIQKLGAITLTARAGDRRLAPEVFSRPGRYTYVRVLDATMLQGETTRIDFWLDKALAPSMTDGRELGVIVSSASLEPN
jgi:hypothetical protein